MTSQHSGRNSRRGGRGGSRRRNGDARGRQQDHQHTPATPKKTGLWAKIASFFNGNNSSKSTADSASPSSRSNNGHAPAARREHETSEPRTSRKPLAVEVTTPRLYVGNLSFDATESDLFDLFNGVGQVQNAEIVSYKHNQRSKGFAFVEMLTVDEAKRAVDELHDKEFLGRKLVVSGAKSSDHARS